MTRRHENAKHADRSQPIHEVGRNAAFRFDFRGTRGDLWRKFPDAGKQLLIGARCWGAWVTKRALMTHLVRASLGKRPTRDSRSGTTGLCLRGGCSITRV